MSITRERADRAVADATRRANLRDAETQSAWVIRRTRYSRQRSKNEYDAQVHDAFSCLHGNPYTIECTKCRRSAVEARDNLNRLKAKLSIT